MLQKERLKTTERLKLKGNNNGRSVKQMDREKVIKAWECCNPFNRKCNECPYERDCYHDGISRHMVADAVALLKEQEGLLGIQQTSDSITFVSTGTAKQGEARGLLLGKLVMHEWLEKELLYRGLLTDDIRAVFDEAKRQEGR